MDNPAQNMTDEMWNRWRWHQHIAQAAMTANSDYRPNARAFVTRGNMVRHFSPYHSSNNWGANWDEKYVTNDVPGQNTDEGTARDIAFRGNFELPNLAQIDVNDSLDQNGIATATITIKNILAEENDDGMGFIYHVMKEGFFSPFYGGDIETFDRDIFQGEDAESDWSTLDGKVISGLIFPNRKVEIFQGYGDELQRTFVGLIDSVEVSAGGLDLKINCSSFGRVAAETTYTQFSVQPGKYPVAFGDTDYWLGKHPDEWKKYTVKTMTLVPDVTGVVGRILAWTGFRYWKRTLAGRIGAANVQEYSDPNPLHNAVFDRDNFDKGANFIDGINQIKDMLGYMFYITPEIHPDSPNAARFRDPDFYDEEYSADLTGTPVFGAPHIWTRDENVEQFLEEEILLDGSLVYDHEAIRKQMYVTGTSLGTANGKSRIVGYHAPFAIDSGLFSNIWFNLNAEFGSVHMTEIEIQILIRQTMIQALLYLAKGSFKVPGWPAVRLNEQIDIKEHVSGTWRRFIVTGYSSSQTLGPAGTYQTTLETVNVDSVYIERIKAQMRDLIGDPPAAAKPRWAETPKGDHQK